jgi:predicted amidohydrolase
MDRPVRVAALQLAAHDRAGFAGAIDGIVDAVRRAAAQADLVVLPEGTLPAYVLGDAPVDSTPIEASLSRLQNIAASERAVIVVGAAARDGASLYNAAFVIDTDGSLAGRADKLFLWHFDSLWFAPGQRLAPVTTHLGSLGVLVCADGRIPTIARALVDAGAVALIMPTAWVTTGRDPQALENVQADLLGRVRAYENGVPFVAANKCGAELGMVAYCGKSQIVDRHGSVVAIAAQDRPEVLHATIGLGAAHPKRAKLPELSPRPAPAESSVRLAVSFEALDADIDGRLEVLGDAYAISPEDGARLALLDAAIPTASLGDSLVADPGGMAAFRAAGYRLICWTTDLPAPWAERLARARALELRVYVVVFDRPRRRAYAVDPDGSVIAGTFDGYHLAGFTFDPRKASATLVAPQTDVAEGLDRIASLAAGEKATT